MTPSTRIPRPRSARPPRAFTLIESVVSLVILSVVLAAATSITYVAARSIPQDSDPSSQRLEAQTVLGQMTGELEQAVLFLPSLPRECCFCIVDPADTTQLFDVAYVWSGTVGDPLYRITRTEKREILTEVSDLAFTYDASEYGVSRRVRRVTIDISRREAQGLYAHTSVRLPLQPEVK